MLLQLQLSEWLVQVLVNRKRWLSVNNATRAFKHTGLFLYNPFSVALTKALETIGQEEKPNAGMHYEIFPKIFHNFQKVN